MKTRTEIDLDVTLKTLLKNRNKDYSQKSQKELINDVYQELKFLGLVPMDAHQKHQTYKYIEKRISQLINEEKEVVSKN